MLINHPSFRNDLILCRKDPLCTHDSVPTAPFEIRCVDGCEKKTIWATIFCVIIFIIYDRSQDSWFMQLLLAIVTDLFATAFIITKHNIQARYDRFWDKWMLGGNLNSKHDLKPKGPAFANMTKVSPQSIYKEYQPSKYFERAWPLLGQTDVGKNTQFETWFSSNRSSIC